MRQTKTRRSDGGYDVADATLAERWASVRPVRGSEQEQSGRMAGTVTYMIELARYDDATTEDAIVWLTRGDARLNIREIRTDALRPLEMTIIAQSGVVQ